MERLERAALLGQNVFNEAKRLNRSINSRQADCNDWNGSLSIVNSGCFSRKYFSILADTHRHFACAAQTDLLRFEVDEKLLPFAAGYGLTGSDRSPR